MLKMMEVFRSEDGGSSFRPMNKGYNKYNFMH